MIQVELSTAEITIEPGSTVQLAITITNHQTHDDHIFIEIEGVDVEWYALPVSSMNLGVGTSQVIRALFKIQRTNSSLAGTYPFLVRARSMETGEAGIQQATLIVLPFSSLQVELSTRRVISTFFKHSHSIDVIVTNLGNHEESIDLYATDPDNSGAYEFEKDRLSLKPGHSETVALQAEPVDRQVIGATRLYGFTVTARSTEHSFVSSNATGQIERHAMVSVLALTAIIAIILATIGYFVFRSKPIVIHAFSVTPRQITAGDTVTVTWDVANATDGVTLMPENIHKGSTGSEKVILNASTDIVLTARSGSNKLSESIPVVVTPAAPPATPTVSAFTSSQKRIHEGETVTLSWKAQGVKTIVLNPLGVQKEWPLYTSQEVKPERTTTYELAAQGPGGTISKSLTVEVVPTTASVAEITLFKAVKDKIITGQATTINYSTDNAASVDIDPAVGSNLKPKGKVDVSPAVTTTYTLRALDNKGNITSKSITITVTMPITPPSTGAGTGIDTNNQPNPATGKAPIPGVNNN